MQKKTKAPAKDPSVVALPWLDPAWMEKMDLFGGRFGDQMSRAHNETLDQVETLVEDQLVFVRERVHADIECAKALSQARDPVEAAQVMADFYKQMIAAYSDCGERAGATLREITAQAFSSTLDLTETAEKAAGAAEEEVERAAKSAKPSAA